MNHKQAHLPHRRLQSGFTLVEMAVVVLLMGIVLTMGLRMLQATQENAAWSETKLKQDRIKVALIGFFRTKGRLPCPDAVMPPTGVEPVAGCATAAAGWGVLPWKVLGLSIGDVQDGWSNFFSYRVADGVPASGKNWTIKAGATAFNIGALSAPLATLTYQERSDTGALGVALVPNPVVMIISHGKNGLGARTVRGTTAMPLPPAGTDERTNATVGSNNFVMRTPTDVAAATGGAFDDVVTYMTPNDLLQPMLDDKTLKGVCSAYCATPGPACAATGIPIGLPNPTCP